MSERDGDTSFNMHLESYASRHVEDQLAAFTGGELSELERRAVERHLAACSQCQAALDATRRIRRLLSSLAPTHDPASIADAILAALPDEPHAEMSPDHTARPVLPLAGVPLPVLRQEPRYVRGRQPSSGRRWNGETGRNLTAMKQSTPAHADRWTPEEMVGAYERQPSARHTRGGRFRSASTLVATIALLALLVGVFSLLRHPTGTAPAPGSRVDIQFNLPPNSQLSAVSMTSATDGWAVGTVNNAPNGMGGPKNALLVHFDGHSWTTSPDSANFPLGQLISVSMDSPTDGWATGSIQATLSSQMRGLVLHYSGGHWRAVDLSGLGFVGGGQVSMSDSGDGWLIAPVGSKTDGSLKTLVLRYHNGAWSSFSSLPGWDLVSMLSATDGWAVGQLSHTILRYQNGAWNQIATTPGQPQALTMTSPTDGWVGGFNATTQSAFVMRFDGNSWSQAPLSHAADAEIDQIVAPAVGDVWVFGRSNTSAGVAPTVAWHLSGGKWTYTGFFGFKAYPTGVSMAPSTSGSGWITGNAAGNTAALMRYQNSGWIDAYYGK